MTPDTTAQTAFRYQLRSSADTGEYLTFLKDQLKDHGYDETARFQICVACGEAIVNAIRHGNKSDPDKVVWVSWSFDEEKLCVQIEDGGQGFNPALVPDPSHAARLEVESGRGIFLMRAFMEVVTYQDPGNCVRMWRRRSWRPEKLEKLHETP